MNLLLLLGCATRVPPAPPIQTGPMPIDRSELPEVELRGMIVGSTRMSRHLGVKGGPKTDERGPIHVFVLSHPIAGTVLIDAGYGRRTAEDPYDHPGRLVANLFELEMQTPAADALADIGVQPGDIDTILLTHLHDDHAAGVEDFPDATLWTDRRDWVYADHKRLLKGIEPEPYAHHTFRHPTYSHGPWGPFEAHTDLFGDGTVLLFPAPGHTPGSMLVLVNTREHSWLFLGDAAWIDDSWMGDAVRPKGFVPRTVVEDDWRQGTEVLYRVQTLRDREDLTIVSGHEPANIERLPTWPEPW